VPPVFDPNNLSQYGAQYVTDPQAAQQHLQDLMAYQQQVQANPTAYPNAQFLLSQINDSIASQNQVIDYATKKQAYENATKGVQELQPKLGNVSSLDDITRNDSFLGRDAANKAVWAKYGKNFKGFELGAGEGNILQHLTKLGGQAEAARLWIDEYKKAVQNAQNQLKQYSGVIQSGDMDKSYGSLLGGFKLPKQDYEYGAQQLRDYYYKPGGQVETATQPAVKDIYAKRWGATMASSEGLNQQGLLGGGARKTQKEKINAGAYNQEQGIKADAFGKAEKSIGDYMNYGAQQNTKAADLENQVKNSGMGDIFGSSVGNAIKDYGQSSQLGNQQAIQQNQQQIQRKEADDKFWNDLAGSVGGIGGTVLGGLL
jgi:hypothetical protein